MTYETVLPIWNALRERFQTKVEAIPEQALSLQLGQTNVGGLLYHTAEVEFMFAEWFFGKKTTEKLSKPEQMEDYIKLLKASNDHFIQAMKELPEEEWQQSKDSPLGDTTPLEAVGRLMNHAGIHAGQISLIQKYGQEG
ncbi:hypothetical protein J14TS2_23090 [Bacillus sp. J14TS2]|uniref:DinB family protein n=1 Tax=Bacillus sp. J14TS2 TaxID=2807188 RepID=UPI001B2F07EF|nr:DinB family protein [Bacillus sp. J14TS2]GIN71834.1 hypothetical protein J14TS2_23090 [Bacillus sp. J14TS2]